MCKSIYFQVSTVAACNFSCTPLYALHNIGASHAENEDKNEVSEQYVLILWFNSIGTINTIITSLSFFHNGL